MQTAVNRALAATLMAASMLIGAGAATAEPYHGGRPPIGAKPSVPDLEAQVAYQRAFEAVVWGMPLVNTHRIRVGVMEGAGLTDNDVMALSQPLTSRHEFLTANNTTPYVTAFTDLRAGPVVVEIPPQSDKAVLFGQIIDAWGVTVESVGPTGADKGAGGKYLLLPPGFSGPVPNGFIPVQSDTFRIAMAFRPIHAKNGTDQDASAYAHNVRIYPLARAEAPPPTRYVDGFPMPMHTLPRYDLDYFRDLYDIVSVEPVKPRDKVMMGMLASIGIERGKPFKPEGKVKAAMERAAVDAYFYMQERSARLESQHPFWPDRHWGFGQIADPNGGFEFETDDEVLIDARADIFHAASFFPKKLVPGKTPVMYLVAFADSAGRKFRPDGDYRVHIPADIPAAQFWSLVPYDEATWAFVYNPLSRVGLSSFDKDKLIVNADGSVDIYFGPKAPAGRESNWIPTGDSIASPQLRLYGTKDALWNGAFKMPDIERLD